MCKLAFVLLMVICFVSFIGSAYASTLVKGDVVYTRSNLRAEGSKIFWHNMRSLRGLVPVGTKVSIERSAGGVITFVTTDTNKTYHVYADSRLWDKYFVKDKEEIGLEGLSPDKKDQVEKGNVVVGMTKEEVYASKGCPAYIAWGEESERIPLAEIMLYNKWYYLATSRAHDVMVIFANGVVVATGGFVK